MYIPAIDMNELPRGVTGTVGQEKRDRVGDLRARCHSLAEWNSGLDGTAGSRRISLRCKPLLVHRRPALGDDDRVDADAVLGQLNSPFARERVPAAISRGVSARPALPRFGNL